MFENNEKKKYMACINYSCVPNNRVYTAIYFRVSCNYTCSYQEHTRLLDFGKNPFKEEKSQFLRLQLSLFKKVKPLSVDTVAKGKTICFKSSLWRRQIQLQEKFSKNCNYTRLLGICTLIDFSKFCCDSRLLGTHGYQEHKSNFCHSRI